MQVGIDISQIVYQGSGVSRYTKELIKALLKYNDKKNKYIFFFSSLRQKLEKKLEKKIKKNFLFKRYFLPPTFLDLLWNRIHIFSIDNFIGKTDLLLTSDWTEPPSFSKKITIIHDLVCLKFPQTLDKKIVNVQKRRLKWVKKESSLILTDSYTTKEDIISLLKIPQEKIKVIYPAVEVIFPSKKIIKNTLIKYNLRQSFILTVGKIEPRKNLNRLINAFIKTKLTNIDLIIVGAKGWGLSNLQFPIPNFSNIKFLGFVSDEELYSLYKSALFFIYPSIYEGFGYPVVEAMKLGCPVATSNTSSLKEIADNACLLFNPYDENAISNAVIKFYKETPLRKKFQLAGIKKSKQFSLKRYAGELINAFNQLQKFN